MSKPVILVDCDGVMADFHGAFLREFTRIHGRVVLKEECTRWQFNECICTLEEEDVVWDYFARTPGLIEGLSEVDADLTDALAYLRNWARVVCVTSPKAGNKLWAGERIAWLNARGFSDKDISNTSDKTLIRGDVLLDDGGHNLDAYSYFGGCLLFNQPWNQGVHHHRTFNWAHAVGMLETFR